MHYDTVATIIALVPTRREVEVQIDSAWTYGQHSMREPSKYKVRVPWYKLQEGFFKVGDKIKIKVIEQDQFAYYLPG